MYVGYQRLDFVSFTSSMFFRNFSRLASENASTATRGTSLGGVWMKPCAYALPVDESGWLDSDCLFFALTQYVCLTHSVLLVQLSSVRDDCGDNFLFLCRCFAPVFFAPRLLYYHHCWGNVCDNTSLFLFSSTLRLFSSHHTWCAAVIGVVVDATTTHLFFCFFSALRLYLSLCACCASLIIDTVSFSHGSVMNSK